MKSHLAVAAFVVAIFVSGAIAQTNQTPQAGPARPAAKAPAKAAPKPAAAMIEGTVKGFECGDNCYLTIAVAPNREEVGLCEAKACVPWFENQEMPKSFVGRRVRVSTSVGVQRDNAGNVMGKMTSFKTLKFVK